MEISYSLREFLNEPNVQKIIDNNDFDNLYRYASFNTAFAESELTELLYTADIDPLNYIDEIPAFYLSGSNIKSFSIPSTMRKIGLCAFSNCEYLENILIPSSVKEIEIEAFAHCPRLTITIPKTVEHIYDRAFSNGTKIIYEGSSQEWDIITESARWTNVLNIEFKG